VHSEQAVAVIGCLLRYGFAMTLQYAIHNWAMLVASVLGTAVLLFVIYRVYQDSAQGRLQAAVSLLHKRESKARVAHKAVEKSAARLERLRAKAESVKPRHGQEASEALEDARALHKIADDQVLIAQNHVRKIILEEFPPTRHDALRNKYLPHTIQEQKPFTMGG
jgi:peptide subunit release factor 1 (eRF1)